MKFYRLLTALIVVFFAFAFVSCETTDSEIDQVASSSEVVMIHGGFDLSLLLESDNEEVRTRAQGMMFLPASLPVGVKDIWATPENPLLPAGDQSVTVLMDGLNVTDINIRVTDFLTGATITTATIPALAGTVSFTIPAYIDPGDGKDRNILLEYQNGGWTYLKIYVQSATSSVPGTATFVSNITGTIPYTGGSYIISATGTEPVAGKSVTFRFIDESDIEVGARVTMTGPARTVPFVIDANGSTSPKRIRLQFSMDGGSSWSTFETHDQFGAPTSTQFRLWVDYNGTIPAAGGVTPVKLEGNFTTDPMGIMIVRAMDAAQNEIYSDNHGIIGTTQKSVDVPIYANNTNSSRMVVYYYSLDLTATWEAFDVKTQAASTTTPTPNWSVDVNCTGIPQGGGNYQATITGDFTGTMVVRAFSGNTDVTNLEASMSGTNKTSWVVVNPNQTSSSRDVTFRYALNGSSTWIDIKTVQQAGITTPNHPGGNYCMTGLGGGNTWAALANAGRGAWGASNCSSYSERRDGSDRGKWRTPGSGELVAMCNAYLAGHPGLAGMQPESLTVFWSNGIAPSNYSYGTAVRINNGQVTTIANPMSSNHYFRCVINENPYKP